MEFPTLGNNCFKSSCKQIDFLPMKCDACSEVFCKDHIQYAEHHCTSAYQKDVQVPVCPLCNKPIPVNRGEMPDMKVSQHIDRDCQSDPATAKRRVYSNKCTRKGCKQKELVPILCSSCLKNFCLRHRHTADHDCKGSTRQTIAHQSASAAIERRDNATHKQRITTVNTQPRPQQQPASTLQAGLSEDEAMRRAIQMSLTTDGTTNQQASQEEEDVLLAKALYESELEERRRRQAQSSRERQRSQDSKCLIS